MVDLGISMAIDTTLNSMAVTLLSSPLGNSAASFLASQLIPPDVLAGLANLKAPDAEVFGGNLAVNPVTTPAVSLAAFAGLEYLVGSGTSEHAWYSYWGGGVTVGGASKGVAITGYGGFVWNCPDAAAYTDVAYFLTVPLSAFGRLVSQVQSLISGLGQGSPTGPSNPVTVSWSPQSNGSTRTFAVTTGVTASATAGTPATTSAPIAWASGLEGGAEGYTLLSGDVNFR